ncbi:MOSC domain-containing protein [Asticcacaulis sp. AC402]|uniref:MOSC domain-containing protein n=1 Tax=Asticcacaulis sp. AC402 TaxID=1282361 RepID=UPI0003C3FDAF|nr:MOSC domain-containing protein [Asticcacaulis sp. AC402]ESQ73781.1 sulfurase [Asticcacaulis sp. AC402]
MTGTVSALWRHPVKGFTPEAVTQAHLHEGGFFPYDRLFALEVGPSGFNPSAPKTVSKMKFAVLARFASVAKLHTRYDEDLAILSVTEGSGETAEFALATAHGQQALARHVEGVLDANEDYDRVVQPLNFLTASGVEATGEHFRFTDSGKGFVSFLNLNSLRDVSARMGGPALDPLRLRANIWVEDWSPFVDHGWVGRTLRIGDSGPELDVLKPIVRCVATHVNPTTAERDIDLCTALWDNYGHRDCGIYARIVKSGVVRPGDAVHLVA